MGFKEIAVQNGARETTDDIPVWRIRTSGDEELFYRVYDGEKNKYTVVAAGYKVSTYLDSWGRYNGKVSNRGWSTSKG